MNLFIHHRDLRNQDNTTLNEMLDEFKGDVNPIFIFAPDQIDPKKNPYFSDHLVEFMCKSLLELHKSYGKSLSFFHGDPIKILSDLHTHYQIQSGAADCIIAGGVETMSPIPFGGWRIVPNSKVAKKNPDWYWGMGLTAEAVAEEFKISRDLLTVTF